MTSATPVAANPSAAKERRLSSRIPQAYRDVMMILTSLVVLAFVGMRPDAWFAVSPQLISLLALAIWAIWPVLRGHRDTNFLWAALRYFVALTALLVTVTTALAAAQRISVKPPQSLDGYHALKDVGWWYTWHLADGVPGLGLPEKTLAVNFTGDRAGMLLLAYKLLVILPVLYILRLWWKKDHPDPHTTT